MSEPEIDFLQEPVEEAAPEVAEVVQETVEQPETPAPVAPTAPEPVDDRVPKAALIAERKKRQEYEARLRELENGQPRQEPPNFFENPDAYLGQALAQNRLAISEAMARELYPDYDEVVQEFVEYAQQNPMVLAELNSQALPAAYAYKQGKFLRERKEMGDPAAYRAKLEAEIRAKVLADLRAEESARQKAASAIPPDLSAARAAKDTDVPSDDSLDSILASRKR